jgi:tetratricopeptide (TPR) repeat protein
MALEVTTLDLSAPIQRRPARVCLNMIVKSEAANLPRLLASVRDHIDCWAVVDTGSTDDTPGIISRALAGVPGRMGSAPFHNFSQARNAALEHAEGCGVEYDYLMLVDADMELVVLDPDYRKALTKGAYSVMQRGGGLTYANVRLLRRNPSARYRGVTHEYIDVPGGDGEVELRTDLIEFKDYATGSNRVNKIERDILLLRAGLEEEPGNERYHYYLAQSFRDGGRLAEAAAWFEKRASMGGFPEEAWAARLNEARCLRQMGEARSTEVFLECFSMRPWRAEPLVDLANAMNNAGKHALAYVYASEALSIPRPPDDILFIEDYAYGVGARQELYIAAGHLRHSPAKFERGFQICEGFALGRGEAQGPRDLARYNLSFFAPMLRGLAPSLLIGKVGFQPPDGFLATNPSLAWHGGSLFLLQRAVNYRIRADGSYEIPEAHGGVVWTRNFLLRLRSDLTPDWCCEVLPPADLPEPASRMGFRGLEDGRLVSWNGELWCSSTACELTAAKWRQILLARIPLAPGDLLPGRGPDVAMDAWRVLHPGPGEELSDPPRNEKNWMPYAEGENLLFHYSLDPAVVVDACGRTVGSSPHPTLALGHLRGGAGSVPFCGLRPGARRGRLCVTHEVTVVDGRRRYLHRFALLNDLGEAVGLSRPFHLARHGAIEFACGIAWAPGSGVLPGRFLPEDRILISFGVEDGESWVGTLKATDVEDMLEQPEEITRSSRR